jgi:hypothetical protein
LRAAFSTSRDDNNEAAEIQIEGGLYIGEWNAGSMQGLGILKYDDGER